MARLTLDISITKQWIREASVRVLKNLDPAKRAMTMGRRDQLAIRATVEGFMEIVCRSWSDSWPPVPQRRSPTAIQVTEIPPARVEVPESFKMDSRRIKNFNADLVELVITYLILRFLTGTAKKHNVHLSVAQARADIEEAFSTGSIPLQADAQAESSDFAIRLAIRIVRPGTVIAGVNRKDLFTVEFIARSIDAFCRIYIKPDSSVYLEAVKSVRAAITTSLTDSLLTDDVSPQRPIKTPTAVRRAQRAQKALEPAVDNATLGDLQAISSDIRELAEKMSRIVSFNIKTFADTYREKGMMVGS